MREYSYIGVAENAIFGVGSEVKFLVRSTKHTLHEGNIVALKIGEKTIYAEVLHAAYVRIGSEEEAMLAEFGDIHDVDKIYDLAWEKKEEVTEDGN